MPTPFKGPRIWLRRRKDSPPTWVIRDGLKMISTGLGADLREEASKALRDYLAAKHQPATDRNQAPENVLIADVLSHYVDAVKARIADPVELGRRVEALLNFWGTKTLAEVSGQSCRSYVARARSVTSAGRELADLRSAINLHRREGLHDRIVSVPLPPSPTPRDKWITRSEAARLIRAAWQARTNNRFSRRHIARFSLVALYTGSRTAAILDASFERLPGRGFIDLEAGIYYRAAPGAARTKKRRPTIPIPTRLLAHMRRWRANGQRHLIELNGQPVESVYYAFRMAARDAGLVGVHPHVMRHSSVSWAMQNGNTPFDIGGFVGMSAQTIARVYAHHAAGGLSKVGDSLTRRPR